MVYGDTLVYILEKTRNGQAVLVVETTCPKHAVELFEKFRKESMTTNCRISYKYI